MSAPLLSAIVIAPEGWAPVRTTVRHLAAQSIAASIEVVFVAPAGTPFEPEDGATAPFAGTRLERIQSIPSIAAGYAAGVRAASAPFVVFSEDHCYPEPEWAESLLAGYDDRTAVVGPVIAHANDEGAIAWVDYLLGYGQWVEPDAGGEVTNLPGHNSSYRREALLAFEPDLVDWLEAESLLHRALAARGWRLVLTPKARSYHFSLSRPSSWLAATYFQYRVFGGRRLAGAGVAKRALYVAAVPLIPAIRLPRILRDARRSRSGPSLLRTLPALTRSLVVSAFGEAIGYALGPGDAPIAMRGYEFRRDLHVNARDRRAIESARSW